jgi:threonine synthase
MSKVLNSYQYQCLACEALFPVEVTRWCCTCGGVLSLKEDSTVATIEQLIGEGQSSSRYLAALPISAESLERVSLGTGRTPLLRVSAQVHIKCDYLLPTGSFKDRGVEILTAIARELHAPGLVVDSSGNAGASLAAHGARAGIPVTVIAPASAPIAKLSQARRHGATVDLVDGDREAVRTATIEHINQTGSLYASHVESPFFTLGTQLWAFEVWEQLGKAPSHVVIPVGNGSLLLGVARGFSLLRTLGVIDSLPQLIAAQAVGWSPLTGSVDGVLPVLADGIAIKAPRRIEEIRRVTTQPHGATVVVTENEIIRAERELANIGIWVEPTAATAWAASAQLREDPNNEIVVNLGGAGFKRSSLT